LYTGNTLTYEVCRISILRHFHVLHVVTQSTLSHRGGVLALEATRFKYRQEF